MTARSTAVTDVLVIGGGPSGSAAAIELANRGHSVSIVERDLMPRAKPCGELVSPRAIAALAALDIDTTSGFHQVDHVRFTFGDRTISTTWPAHDDLPDHAIVADRGILDQKLVDKAQQAGATLLEGYEATSPIVERGFVRGAHVTTNDGKTLDIRAGYTVVADGANSRFGRALGTFREPDWPHASAHRAIYRSALHSAAEAEFIVDLADRAGTAIAGYGWMFPRGDGTVNVGILLMSTSPSFKVLNPVHVLDRLIADHAERWHLAAEPESPPMGGRIPMGNSVNPVSGPTYLVVGDAAGAANPITAAGIEYALDTGTLAAQVLDEALDDNSAAALQQYPQLIRDRYASFFKVGRLANRLMSHPAVNRRFASLLVSHRSVTDAILRISMNELRDSNTAPPEIAYRIGRTLSAFAPDA